MAKLLMHPGGALFVLAGLALVVFLAAGWIPFLGGFIKFLAVLAMILGVVGGTTLTLMMRKKANT